MVGVKKPFPKVMKFNEKILKLKMIYCKIHVTGAESIGYPGITHGMFENGAVDLVYYFYTNCNQELNEILKKKSLETSPDGSAKKESPGEQVKDALEIRLKMVVPYKDTWPQAIALMALPPNVPTSLKHLLTVVDDICYYAGDKSTDVSRFILVIKLQDSWIF